VPAEDRNQPVDAQGDRAAGLNESPSGRAEGKFPALNGE
jgi:hypothetical protein